LRGDSRLRADAVAGRATAALQRIKEAQIFAFTPPPIIELGTANGIDVQLVDRVGLGHEKLMAARNQLMGMLQQESAVTKVRPNGQDDTAQYKIDIDWQKASTLGVSFAEVNSSLSSTWGQSYVNDFIDNGRVKKVFMQADSPFRMTPQDVNQWFVRNMSGTMTPFSAFATGRWIYGSPRLERFNGVPSMELLGEPALGFTSGDAMKVVEANVSKLPQGVGVEWSGISFDERMSGSGAAMLYLISLAVVFLALAALYESWSVPFVVLLVVPLGVIGAVVASTARGLSNDIYFQVGLLTTIGLSAKNAILIVEFAKARYQSGQGLVEATIEAARLRLRPILMTSVAFIMGVLPLALSHGVGAGGQNAIGWSVVGGMTSATVLAILFIPVFFVVVTRLTGKRQEVAVAAPLGEIAPEPAE
jgi:multidrug efflux pump